MANFGNIFDIDNYTDAAKSVANSTWDAITSIADAGHLIGNILKGISPALSFIPGLGTGLAVGFYAAGAIASADPITDIVIGSVSAGMPPGLPRIAFDGAANMSKDIAAGQNAFGSAVDAMRKVANESGPQAGAAFDSALNMARGGKIDPRLIAEARASFANGGKTAEMAFDAGIGVAKGESSDQIALDVARNYIRDAGGPVAAAAFDSGVALAYGQTLQEAGWAGLHTLVRGNNPVEMIIEFVKQVGFANAAGIAVPEFLENSMVKDAMGALKGAAPTFPDFDKVKNALQPMIDVFQKNPAALNIPSGELAKQWGIDEALVRAAQSVVDKTTGAIDKALLDKFSLQDAPGTEERNDNYAASGEELAASDPNFLGRERKNWSAYRSPAWMRGFDIGVAVTHNYTEWGPGQAAIRDSLLTLDQYNGFNYARDLIYNHAKFLQNQITGTVASQGNSFLMADPNSKGTNTMGIGRNVSAQERAGLEDWARKGQIAAAGNPTVTAVRNLIDDGNYRWGFDIGTSVSLGHSLPGPGQDAVRNLLDLSNSGPDHNSPNNGGPQAFAGFDSARALQYGITKGLGATPAVAAGTLMVNGMAGSGMTPAQKASVVTTALNNPAVGAGATAAVQAKTGIWHDFWAFFGLA